MDRAISFQPTLECNRVLLQPLQHTDFTTLYNAAADPKIWEQHPNRDRWQKSVFRNFFKGALESKGAFKVTDKFLGIVVGSTRFYNYNDQDKSIFIGYTFYAVSSWGQGINSAVKMLMLDYIFEFVDRVYFHIGAENYRSQIAISKIGAHKIAEVEVAYRGEGLRKNYLYRIKKEHWLQSRLKQ